MFIVMNKLLPLYLFIRYVFLLMVTKEDYMTKQKTARPKERLNNKEDIFLLEIKIALRNIQGC